MSKRTFAELKRVNFEGGSRIEPALKPIWLPLKRLQWKAAVTSVDTGLHVTVKPADYRVSGIGQFGVYEVGVEYAGTGPLDYRSAWSLLTGVEIGANQMKRTKGNE